MSHYTNLLKRIESALNKLDFKCYDLINENKELKKEINEYLDLSDELDEELKENDELKREIELLKLQLESKNPPTYLFSSKPNTRTCGKCGAPYFIKNEPGGNPIPIPSCNCWNGIKYTTNDSCNGSL